MNKKAMVKMIKDAVSDVFMANLMVLEPYGGVTAEEQVEALIEIPI